MFTPANFLLRLAGLITYGSNGNGSGLGFIRSASHTLKSATGLGLTAGTNPLVAAFETNHIGVQWASGDSTKAMFTFVVPLDYDTTSDYLSIVLEVNSNGNTNAPTFTANVYSKRAGTALTADLAPAASAAIAKSATATTALAETTILVQGKGLKPRDVVTIYLAPGTHATDAVNLYGLEVRYRSTLVAFNSADR